MNTTVSKTIKLLLLISISFICAAFVGRFIVFIIEAILPISLIIIAWIFGGAVTSYCFMLFASIGFVFIYPAKENSVSEDFIKGQESVQSIIAVFLLLISGSILINSLIIPNDKFYTISLSMIAAIVVLFIISAIRFSIKTRLEKKKDALKEKIENCLLIQTLSTTKIKLESGVNWQDRQELELQLIWLETLSFVGKVVDKTLEEKVMYFESIDEADIIVPEILDIKSFSDFKFSQDVAFKYAEFIYDSKSGHENEKILPFPKADIVRLCKHYGKCLSKNVFASSTLLLADKERAKKVAFAVLEAEAILKNEIG